MELLPAIDLRGGQAVRLTQGDFARQQSFGDPCRLAKDLVSAGARWLHIVDLDAARTGAPVHRDLVRALVEEVGVPVQVGGGIRAAGDVEQLLDAGVARVVLGTAAVEDPNFAIETAGRYPGRVALGLDYRRRADGSLEGATRGWVEGSARTVPELLAEVAGAPLAAVVVTAIERDGTLAGPDLRGLVSVLGATELPVIASGGIGSTADLQAVAALRSGGRTVEGVIVGRALVDGTMTMEEALPACVPSG